MLFKESLNIDAEEIKKYISVNVSLELNTVKPYITQAERKYIKRLLGTAQYNELVEFYNSGSGSGIGSGSGSGLGEQIASSAKLTELLEMVQLPLINLACYLGFDLLVTKVSNQGAYRTETDKQKGLYQYQEVSLRNTFKASGFDALDDLLAYLEENKDDFPNWKNSSEYTSTKLYLINSTAEFDEIYPINESRLVFMILQKFMRLVENAEIVALLGRELFNEIKLQISAGDLSAANEIILIHLKTALAFLTVSRAANEMGVTWSDKGLYFEFNDTASSNMRKQQITDADRLQTIISNARKTGLDALEAVREIMVNNIADYPLYSASTAYNDGIIPKFNNTSKKTFTV